MDHFLKQFLNSTENQADDNMVCRPNFFQLHNEASKEEFAKFLEEHSDIFVADEIHSQLTELIKLRFPKKKFSSTELEDAINDHLDGADLSEYGQWVYYPWLNKLVHILPETEFIEVRTNRNQYKITPEEEEVLANKKIGIIGLSVGKAIALTMALERICGELVLADFDVVELSNLNRIQTGIHNCGLKKTVIVAREIAEIDPYLKVTCIHEGLTEENVDQFFTNGKKLDVCIEVCDGLYTKIFARQKAKELGVPVVMNSSDRGTTDIERFDLEPDLPILHGLIDHLDLSKVKQAKTNEEKVPYLLPMLGVETSSDRLKASMLEIEETITTWPQLASGVVFGGGICTDVCRRILLNQITDSGRYFVDVEQKINNDVEDYIAKSRTQKEEIKVIPNPSKKDYERILKQAVNHLKFDPHRVDLAKDDIEALVKAASIAPSGGNMQPWKWIYENGVLYLFVDPNRTDSVLNYANMATFIAHGAAIENLVIKANSLNLKLGIKRFPLEEYPSLTAVITFERQTNTEYMFGHLLPYLEKRSTNRKVRSKGNLTDEQFKYFSRFEMNNDRFRLNVYNERQKMNKLKEVLMEVDQLYYTSKLGHENFMKELRWTPQEAKVTKDGVDLKTIDLTPTEEAGFRVSKKWQVVNYLNNWNLGAAYSKLTGKGVDGASALVIITGPKKLSSDKYLDCGRLIEQLWLTATSMDLAFQPMSISSFLFTRAHFDQSEEFSSLRPKLLELDEKFRSIINISDSESPLFVFRLAKADEHKTRALRRNLNDVLVYDG